MVEEAPDDARGSTLTSLTNVYSVKALSASEVDEAGMLYRLSSGSLLFKFE